MTKTQGTCPADTASPPDSDCVGYGWIPNSGTDWQDFYHGEFRGFGTVLITSPAGDLTAQYYAATYGWDSSASDPRNYLTGQLLEEDAYQGSNIDGTKLITQTTKSYGGQNSTHDSCASTSTYPSTTYRPCEIVLLSSRTTTYEQTGSGNGNAPWTESDNTYDDYTTSSGLGDYHQNPATASYHNLQTQVITSSNAPTRTRHWTYYTTYLTTGGFVYYQVHTVAHSDIVDDQSHMWQCQDTTYDQGVGTGVPTPAAGWPTTVTYYSDCSHQSTSSIKTYNGYDNYGNLVASVDGFAAANPTLYTSAGCTLATTPSFFPTGSWSSSHYTDCYKYDPISSLKTDTWNVLSQHSSTIYDATQGQLPTSTTDVNGQVTSMSYSYDGSGNKTLQVKLPNAASSYTKQSALTSACIDSSTLPCLEIDSNTALYSSAVTKTFYDSLGRSVETLTPGPDASHTTVSFTVYYDQTHSVFTSLPFVVNSRTTWLDPTGATYSASYDSWGNITSRTYAGVTATLTYDVLDHLVKWDAGTGNKEWYAYDASGNRVLLRSITTSGTNNTTYPFGLEEHTYNATGSNIGNTYYYTLGGRLIGALSGTTTLNTQFFLTDALGSVLATFSATAGSAAVLGNQVYGPYGNQRYNAGPMGTTKGFTGQYADPSGLDYYNARYYDPVVGVFLSADTVQGNLQGMNPYGYVNGDPETYNDPKGQYYADMNGDTYHQGAPFYQNSQGTAYNIYTGQLYNGNGYKNGWLPTQGANARPSHSTSKGQRVPTHVHVVPVPAGVLAPALVKLAQKLIRNNTRLGGDFGSNQWTVLSVEDGGTIINDNSGGVYTHRWYFTMDDGNGSKVVLSLNLNSAPGAKDPWDMQHIHFSSDEYQPDPGKWGTQGYERNIDWFDPGASEDPGEESAMSAFAQAMLEAESDIESSIIDEDLAE